MSANKTLKMSEKNGKCIISYKYKSKHCQNIVKHRKKHKETWSNCA